ncbi:MAG: ISNCY family transposase [Dehalococcoidales bacterium]|nr:ISNCY family transposase [Dehalococcoidales bacterium]
MSVIMKEGLTLTEAEQGRLQVLNLVLQGGMGARGAAGILGLSERHVWRVLSAYRRGGAEVLAHGNRGQPPANRISEEVRQQVIELAQTKYRGFNHTHLTELLAEREGVALARSTVRGILVGAGLPSPRHRRPPRHRCRRERMPQEGVLLQLDGSYHDWLEGRGPWLTLLLAIDDATGTVPYALFQEHEDTRGYFKLLWGVIQSKGVPLAVYTDRHAVFQPPRRPSGIVEESSSPERGRTQFGRALRELGVCPVFAHSPEAKGRIERAAGTFQDRLVSELRAAGVDNMTDANRLLWEYLPRFNKRFGVPPAEEGAAYRTIATGLDIGAILCFKHDCKVAKDNTVKYRWRTLQLLPDQDRRSYAGATAEIQLRLDGSIVAYHQGQLIPTREAPPRPGILRQGSGNCNLNRSTTLPKWITDGFGYDNANPGSNSWHRRTLPGVKDRQPTIRQRARWKAVQAAIRRGLGIRATARELGISRNTIKKYLVTGGPTPYPSRRSAYPVPSERNAAQLPAPLTESLVINT